MAFSQLPRSATASAQIRDGILAWGTVALAAIFVAFVAAAIVALLARVAPATIMTELRRPIVLQALALSLKTTGAALALTVAFGTPLAAVLTRRFFVKPVIEALVTLPVVLPPVVAGLALLLAFGHAGLAGRVLEAAGIRIAFTSVAVVLAQTFVAAPLYIVAAKAAFESIDPDLVDAAATLRATPAYAFMRVVLPAALPALAGGLLLSWARALGEFGATITFAGNLPGVTQTMPLAVYIEGQEDLDAAIAVAAVLLVVAFGALVLMRAFALTGRRRA